MDKSTPTPRRSEALNGQLAVCAFLEKSHLFKGVEPADLGQLFDAGRLELFQNDDLILCEGEPGDRLYLIYSGSVRVMASCAAGAVELAHLSRGAIFGEVSMLTGRPRTATVMAAEPVQVISFERLAMEPLLGKYPKVRKLMQTMMAARAKGAIDKVQP